MMKSVGSRINKAASQIRQTFLGLVARGGSKVLQLKGFSDETLQEVELIQQVGFSSYIPEGAKVVVLPLQGKTAKSVVIATTGGKVVVNVETGQTCVFDQFGHQVLLGGSGVKIKGSVQTNLNVSVGTGVTGTFTSAMGQIITVANGIIVGIE